ncbi:MAG: response regulator transcription factor [Cyclobacteriaceae bacterium]|nr:response regulator transcription factor [Cyclobacteriaceae bacterium]
MNVLVVESELHIVTAIEKELQRENFIVESAKDALSGLELLTKSHVDLIILDAGLPGVNGIELCKIIREKGFKDTPILMLTLLNSIEDVEKGLDAGADDYLAKPFRLDELLGRVKALSRKITQSQNLQVADLTLDRLAKVAIRGGKEIKLTSTEYRLLEYLMQNRRKVLSRGDILKKVWDIRFDTGTNVLDVYVNYLRKKIDKGYDTKLIQTAKGMGYVIKEEI